MAPQIKRVLKIDVSKNSRDFVSASWNFRDILDATNLNDGRLRKTLGGLLAHAKRSGDEVEFFIMNDEGRFPQVGDCSPVSTSDIEKASSLSLDFQELSKKVELLRQDPAYREVCKHFDDVKKLPDKLKMTHLWKWRADRGSEWKLVWVWGFNMKSQEPGEASLCANNSCQTLFIKRENADKCPLCKSQPKPYAVVEAQKPISSGTSTKASKKVDERPRRRSITKKLLIGSVGVAAIIALATLFFYPGAYQQIGWNLINREEPRDQVRDNEKKNADESSSKDQLQTNGNSNQEGASASKASDSNQPKPDEPNAGDSKPVKDPGNDEPEKSPQEDKMLTSNQGQPGGEKASDSNQPPQEQSSKNLPRPVIPTSEFLQKLKVDRVEKSVNSGKFRIALKAELPASDIFEFRVRGNPDAEEQRWTRMEISGKSGKLELLSHQLELMENDHVYSIQIERRQKGIGKVEQQTFRFRLNYVVEPVEDN